MSKRMEMKYTSGWFTVILPTLEFLLLWIGPPVLIFSLLRWNVSEWVAISICAASVAPALAICVLTYPFLLRLAERGKGEISLDGGRIRWRSGRCWHAVDLTKPYQGEIAAGYSGTGYLNASLSVGSALMVHCKGIARDQVLHAFPEPFFVAEMALTPEEGLWGFNLDAGDEASRTLFLALLSLLWETRDHNEYYQLFQKFPWHRRPSPEFPHIRVLAAQECTAEWREFIARLRAEAISTPVPWLSLTPDYLLGEEADWRDTLKGETARYFIMPLGHVQAETTLPRPDWKSFFLGNFIIHALGGSAGTHIRLAEQRFLRITGRDEHRKPLTVAFEWLGPGDDRYRESEYFVRFVNRAL